MVPLGQELLGTHVVLGVRRVLAVPKALGNLADPWILAFRACLGFLGIQGVLFLLEALLAQDVLEVQHLLGAQVGPLGLPLESLCLQGVQLDLEVQWCLGVHLGPGGL